MENFSESYVWLYMKLIDITKYLSIFQEIYVIKGDNKLWQHILKRDSNGTTTITE